MDQIIVDFWGSTTVTAATKRLSEALRVNNVELFLLWIKADQGLQCGTEVSSGSLSSILKGRYLLKRRKVTVTSLNVIAELFLMKF